MSEAIAQKLEEACALIEKGWAQRSFAQNAAGNSVGYLSKNAVRFCATGALLRVDRRFEWDALDTLEQAVGCDHIPTWNDAPERTQAEVVDAFKKAAELARGQS